MKHKKLSLRAILKWEKILKKNDDDCCDEARTNEWSLRVSI
jgi:hypothetical protein